MLCPYCMLEYTVSAPCFCHSVVHVGDVAPSPMSLDVVNAEGEFNFAVLGAIDLPYTAPYLGA